MLLLFGPSCLSVGRLVCRSIGLSFVRFLCYNLQRVRVVILPCSYWGTCFSVGLLLIIRNKEIGSPMYIYLMQSYKISLPESNLSFINTTFQNTLKMLIYLTISRNNFLLQANLLAHAGKFRLILFRRIYFRCEAFL